MPEKIVAFLMFMCLGYPALSQRQMRSPGESSEAFLQRVVPGNIVPDKTVSFDFNNRGEKLICFYNHREADTAVNRTQDSIATLHLMILVQDTANLTYYQTIDLELDRDRGYGLGVESSETIRSKKEKKLNITVFHLQPGPGKVRFKGYEQYTLRQRSNNAGYFNDFELINLR